MTTYRITYRERRIASKVAEFMGDSNLIQRDRSLKSPGRMEIRNSEGDVFRLQENTEFVVQDTEEGLQPVIYGEVFAVVAASWMKYRTSCYSCRSHASAPLQVLVRPNKEHQNTDEYLLAMGDMVVHDFDEHGRHFVICSLEEGEKAQIQYNPDVAIGRAKYIARIEKMSDEDWNYVQSEFLDSRRWMD